MASFDDVNIFDVGSIEPRELTPSEKRLELVAQSLQKMGYTPRRSYQMANKITGLGETVGEFLPGTSTKLAEERGDKLGIALSHLDYLGPAGTAAAIPVKVARKGIKAYHGSPHRFDKFDIEQIGTGEGSQVYGRGLYFAEAKDVGRQYKTAGLEDLQVELIDGTRLPHEIHLENIVGRVIKDYPKLGRPQAIRIADEVMERGVKGRPTIPDHIPEGPSKKYYLSAIEANKGAKLSEGSLYEVNIKASPDELIDWDAPIKKQSKVVQEKVDKLMKLNPKDYQTREMPHAMSKIYFRKEGNPHGTDLITYLHSNFGFKETPKILESVGIKGIKYADAFSRGKSYEVKLFVRNKLYKTEPITANSLENAEDIASRYKQKGFDTKVEKTGTSNYVIFDPRIIEIAKQYGVAIPVAGAMLYQQDFGDLGKSTDAPLEGNTREIL